MATQRKTVETLAGLDGTNKSTKLVSVYPVSPENATNGNDGAALPEPSRFASGRTLETKVHDWLTRNEKIQAVQPCGVEHLYPDSFCRVLRRVRTADVVKFCANPDFVILLKTGCIQYVECKSSRTIEKNVYARYVDLDRLNPVWLILEIGNKYCWQKISEVRFVDSADYTRCYSDPFSIDDEGWITSGRTSGRSGNPCRPIDLSSMVLFDMEGAE